MTSHDSLQQLRDLDKTSPQFHEQLSNFFRGNIYQDIFPNLQSESLTWLVEYLDSVRLSQIHPPMLNIGVGSGQCFRSRRPRVPRILA